MHVNLNTEGNESAFRLHIFTVTWAEAFDGYFILNLDEKEMRMEDRRNDKSQERSNYS